MQKPEHQRSPQTDLLERFSRVRKKTEELCAPLSAEDFIVSVTEDTSPPKWHLAHTSWFFEHFILKKSPGYEVFNHDFDFIFNSYYKTLGTFLPKAKRNVLSRPTIDEVLKYRRFVSERVCDVFAKQTSDDLLAVLEIGINHEEQHQELLLMDIKRNFFENPLRPRYSQEGERSYEISQESRWHNLPSGLYHTGVDRKQTSFAYDNEKDRHQSWVESCMLSSHLVTNDEYLEFMESGGYENPRLWFSDGWDLKEKENWSHPLYWERHGRELWTMTLSGMRPLDLAAPVVHVSFYEASAFAKWRGCRLPTEAEWEVAATQEKIQGQFLEAGELDPQPADEDFELFSQIHGTVWEWTMSPYLPYPRYEALKHGLSEYNEKFMVNQMVLRGGCALTPKDHYRPTYRNFYYPHMRWQYAGIRLAKDLA